ncbi:MAG TPA: flagellar hook-associated protein FlgK [Pusillimonas sp.]|uniref:flagellar hook-associated protein FlgK n=1 Tax=Pusillimonas sp. TaxID=3040095 RepID=UPI002CEED70E|nr:flagellar hook-associated protein FlgK [Pusillimonas sp.]HUH88893.1 flagellar hook-associated protein FlgK [Pusillimonas sp.]
MNLANLGLSGLAAATARLQTTGHNINNADTDGYNRQSVVVSTAGGRNMGYGFIGQGVRTDSIERSYNNFLYRQLVNAQTTGASLVTYGNEITQVNNLFGDRTVGVSPALQKFFDGIQAVASAPADPAARQELLGRASSLVGQINDANAFLDSQRQNINTQVSTVVTQINSYVEQVRDLNHQIVVAKASSSGQPPNDLLDQREQVVSELSQLAGVRIIEQDGSFNITIGNGQVLLGGATVFPLVAVPSASDPTRTAVAYSAPSGAGQTTLIELSDKSIGGGSLGGLLKYRSEALDSVQNDLGRLAMGLAMAVNEIHQGGYDINGNPGVQFFTVGDPKVTASVGNKGTGVVAATVADSKQLTAQDYRVEFDGVDYKISSVPSGSLVFQGNTLPASFEGVEFNIDSGSPVAGDSWFIQPTRHAAGNLKLALDSASQIAAAGSNTGQADGDNALLLAALQTTKTLGNGSMSFNEAYSQIVNQVGVMTQQNGTAAKAQATLIQQNYAAQQAVSGVNLNEEYVKLERYQEQFRAASRLIDVSSTLFDTLLSLRN